MKHILKNIGDYIVVVLVTIFIIFPIISITSCTIQDTLINSRFEHIQNGMTKDLVISYMGKPSLIDKSTDIKMYLPYAEKCSKHCISRFWYLNRLNLEVQLWMIDFDKNNQVIYFYKFVMP